MYSMELEEWEGASDYEIVWSHIGERARVVIVNWRSSGGGWLHGEVRRDELGPGGY